MTDLSKPVCCGSPMKHVAPDSVGGGAWLCLKCYRCDAPDAKPPCCSAMTLLRRLVDPEDLWQASLEERRVEIMRVLR